MNNGSRSMFAAIILSFSLFLSRLVDSSDFTGASHQSGAFGITSRILLMKNHTDPDT
jgi:hypothetical protein